MRNTWRFRLLDMDKAIASGRFLNLLFTACARLDDLLSPPKNLDGEQRYSQTSRFSRRLAAKASPPISAL